MMTRFWKSGLRRLMVLVVSLGCYGFLFVGDVDANRANIHVKIQRCGGMTEEVTGALIYTKDFVGGGEGVISTVNGFANGVGLAGCLGKSHLSLLNAAGITAGLSGNWSTNISGAVAGNWHATLFSGDHTNKLSSNIYADDEQHRRCDNSILTYDPDTLHEYNCNQECAGNPGRRNMYCIFEHEYYGNFSSVPVHSSNSLQSVAFGVKGNVSTGTLNVEWTFTETCLAPTPTDTPTPTPTFIATPTLTPVPLRAPKPRVNLNSCVYAPLDSNVGTFSWVNNSVPVTWVDVSESPFFELSAQSDYYKNVTGTTSTSFPDGFRHRLNGSSLTLVSGRTYYVRTWNGSHSELTNFVVNSQPPAPVPVINPNVSCLNGPVNANVLTASWVNTSSPVSWLNLDTDMNWANGFYNRNVTGQTSIAIPNGFGGLSIAPNVTYNVSTWDGCGMSSSATFMIPACGGLSPTPTPYMEVNLWDASDLTSWVDVGSICRITDTDTNYLNGMTINASTCNSNVGYHSFPVSGGGAPYQGGRVSLPSDYAVIGVTPAPGGGYPSNYTSGSTGDEIQNYLWSAWSSGGRSIDLVVATVTPTPSPTGEAVTPEPRI